MPKVLWTQRANFGPSRRVNSRAAFDSKRGRVVLFGGQSDDPNEGVQGILGDTWEWDGSFWTQASDIGPPGRAQHAMAFDSKRNITILFGGSVAQTGLVADTWQWDGQDWTQLLDSGPPPRSQHALAFDSARNRTVLFGGNAGFGQSQSLFQDTWEFDGQEWAQRDDSGPPARADHGMAFDSTSGRTILFGGTNGPTTFGDTWAWDALTWVQVAEFGPPARETAVMAAFAGSVVLFGGGTFVNIFADTWQFDGKRWIQRQDIGPGPRVFHTLAFDSSRNVAVMFGGSRADGAGRGDTWELRGASTGDVNA